MDNKQFPECRVPGIKQQLEKHTKLTREIFVMVGKTWLESNEKSSWT